MLLRCSLQCAGELLISSPAPFGFLPNSTSQVFVLASSGQPSGVLALVGESNPPVGPLSNGKVHPLLASRKADV